MENLQSGKRVNVLYHVGQENAHVEELVRNSNPLLVEMIVLESLKKRRIVIWENVQLWASLIK